LISSKTDKTTLTWYEITAILEYIVIVILKFHVSQNYVVNIFITTQGTLTPL